MVSSFATVSELQQTPSGSGGPYGMRPFVVGTENRLADFAIRAMLGSKPGGGESDGGKLKGGGTTRYNPLLLYGPAGVGKSHLVHALATAWAATTESKARESNTEAQLTVIRWTGADFYRQVAAAKQSDSLSSFRRQLSTASLLVIEDIEQLAAKTSAKNELARLIDDLTRQGDETEQEMLLVITAQQPPRRIAMLSAELRSRLSAGLAVAVAPPSKASRLKIVRHLASERGLSLSEAAAKLLAQQIKGTARDLLRGLLELQMISNSASRSSSLQGPSLQGPSLRATRDYLAQRAVAAQPTLTQILTVTARHFSLPPATLRGPSRSQLVVTARSIAIFLSRELTDHSFQEIGRLLGGRDHTTILHSDRKIRRLVGQDPVIAQTTRELRSEVLVKV